MPTVSGRDPFPEMALQREKAQWIRKTQIATISTLDQPSQPGTPGLPVTDPQTQVNKWQEKIHARTQYDSNLHTQAKKKLSLEAYRQRHLLITPQLPIGRDLLPDLRLMGPHSAEHACQMLRVQSGPGTMQKGKNAPSVTTKL